MKFLIDLNLSPSWKKLLTDSGWSATHWSEVGSLTASDAEIMEWARQNGHIVLTHDLDFGELLALTKSSAPSVVQLRTQEVISNKIGSLVVSSLHQWEEQLIIGALMSIDVHQARVRLLPFSDK
jgi:predicted nuclease of predicted toxin-antitoxin system